MREISMSEVNQVSGGFNCIDQNIFKKMQNKAIVDGIIFSAISTALIGCATFGISSSLLIAGGVGVVIAPYAAGFGYLYSDSWGLVYA